MPRHCPKVSRTGMLGSCLAATLIFGAAPNYAQTSIGTANNWSFEVTPYLWGAAMTGDVQAANLPRTSVDMSLSDILDVFDFGLMGAFEARKGRLGLYFDAIYIKVSDSATARRTGPGPIGATLTATADAKLEQTMLAFAVMYRAVEGNTPVDVLAGVRYTDLEVDASIGASLFARTGVVNRAGSKDWSILLSDFEFRFRSRIAGSSSATRMWADSASARIRPGRPPRESITNFPRT